MNLHLQEGFEAFRHAYRAAIKEVRTKIEILSEDFAVRHDYNPIHHIERRLKTPDSIEEKLTRLGKEITIASARENIFDIAGIRVVCNFIDDVYAIADMLTSQSDVKLLTEKDYIKNPKPNGYRSLHLAIAIPVSSWRCRSGRSRWTFGRVSSTSCATSRTRTFLRASTSSSRPVQRSARPSIAGCRRSLMI